MDKLKGIASKIDASPKFKAESKLITKELQSINESRSDLEVDQKSSRTQKDFENPMVTPKDQTTDMARIWKVRSSDRFNNTRQSKIQKSPNETQEKLLTRYEHYKKSEGSKSSISKSPSIKLKQRGVKSPSREIIKKSMESSN